MKRYTLTLFAAVLALLSVQADRRTDAAMRQLAAQALSQTSSTRLRTKAQEVQDLKAVKTMEQLTLFAYDDAGWAIVSHDDAFTPVLGYGDSPLDMANPSPEFLWLLKTFNAGMADDLKQGTASTRRQVRSKTCSVLREVKPLLKTNWNQAWPYNTKCPMVQGEYGKEYCITGCVATAFAQVLYYLKLPRKAHGTKSYTWANTVEDNPQVLSYDFSAQPFDWDNIPVNYDPVKGTKAQLDALGNLMYACGVMANMNYTPTGSGAACPTVSNSINNHFEDLTSQTVGYYQPKNGTHMPADLIASELNAGRPLVFSGSDKDEKNGHAFVIDGSDAKGYVHCNLGWSGQGNGYFAMDEMSGYPTFQTLSTVVPSVNLAVGKPCADLNMKSLTADTKHPATELTPDQWYVMWNEGRSVALCDKGKGVAVGTSTWLPDGKRSEYLASTVVRLVPNAAGTRYSIQTGLGNYLPAFGQNATGNATISSAATYAISTIVDTSGQVQDGHFCLVSTSNVRMDCNGNNIVGWETGTTKEVGGNASWQFYPVSLADVTNHKPVEDIILEADTVRLLVGGKYALSPTVTPADASVPYVSWTNSKNVVAAVDNGGNITAKTAGTTLITASSVDGTDLARTCTVMVGTRKQTTKLSSLMFSSIYLLMNGAGTGGYLVADGEDTTHPVLRGIQAKSAAGCKDELYWEDAELGHPTTLWQIPQDEAGNYYLYNLGVGKFLINGEGEQTEYVFSDTPKPVNIAAVGEEDFTDSKEWIGSFYFNCGQTDGSRLMAATNFLNPAHWLDSETVARKKQSVWTVSSVSGLNKGLKVWTKDAFNKFIAPEGISSASLRGGQSSVARDLTGRAVAQPARGVVIQGGKKIIR